MSAIELWREPLLQAVFWSAATIAGYLAAKALHRRLGRWWSSPVVAAPVLLLALILATRTPYSQYLRGTHWLVALLGPATVAFAVPIYQQRRLIVRNWPVLAVGVLVGSTTAVLSAWGLATALGLPRALELSLLPRSLSTPFAMIVSGQLGGAPSLTAVFVIITGVFGAAVGEVVLLRLGVRSALAKGALFGMGAHAIGTARAHQIDGEVGAIAGLIMVLTGVGNVLAAPLLAMVLR